MNIDITTFAEQLRTESKLAREQFNYSYPNDLIAQSPTSSRTASRMLVRKEDGSLTDHQFHELPKILSRYRPLILRNASRVIPARLIGKTDTGAQTEIFLLEPCEPLNFGCLRWHALGRPLKRLPIGKSVFFSENLCAKIENIDTNGKGVPLVTLEFQSNDKNLLDAINSAGQVPLPPYINRARDTKHQGQDSDRYQTVYAKEVGSVAAPTAGLHFDESIEKDLIDAGCELAHCTLHVGAGTFLPVKDQDINQHNMHQESYSFTQETVEKIISAHMSKRPILSVGTTSFRALEAYALLCEGEYQTMRAEAGRFHSTNLFLRPIDAQTKVQPPLTRILMTNFHQPESTLIMLVAALIGYDAMKKLYDHAVHERYRLFSYGDSSLLFLDGETS